MNGSENITTDFFVKRIACFDEIAVRTTDDPPPTADENDAANEPVDSVLVDRTDAVTISANKRCTVVFEATIDDAPTAYSCPEEETVLLSGDYYRDVATSGESWRLRYDNGSENFADRSAMMTLYLAMMALTLGWIQLY